MSQSINPNVHADIHVTHDGHHVEHNGDGHHHHKETFITKYIFSQDHKMISKQFLVTGMLWAIVGAFMSVLFRLQLAYPDESFPILESLFGRWAKGGQIQPEFYYGLITMHGTILVYFCIDGWIERYVCQLPDPSTNRCPRYGITFHEHVVILVLLLGKCNFDRFIVCQHRPCKWWLDILSAIKCLRTSQ